MKVTRVFVQHQTMQFQELKKVLFLKTRQALKIGLPLGLSLKTRPLIQNSEGSNLYETWLMTILMKRQGMNHSSE